MSLPRLFLEKTSDSIILSLEGDWTLEGGLPADVLAWEQSNPAGPVVLNFKNLGAWDSMLLTFLAKVNAWAQAHGQSCVFKKAPEGIEPLLELCQQNEPKARGKPVLGSLARFGLFCLHFYKEFLAFSAFVGEVAQGVGRLLRGKAKTRWCDFALMLEACGMDALPVVSLVSVLIGVVLSFVGIIQLRQFGAQLYVADLVGLSMVREMGALMVGIVLAGRTGAAFAAQIGNMIVSEEIDALKTLAIHPVDFLVLPRMMALLLMVPLLCIYADVIGILGSIFISIVMMDLSITQYLNELELVIQFKDVFTGLIKSVAFGTVVALVGCLRGLQCEKSAEGVGRATTSAVVTSIVLIVFCDTVFAFVFNLLGI